MKVIIIKDCKDGKVNDIIEVKDGYGKNFLIKNNFALAYNEKNLDVLKKQLANQNKKEEINKEKVIKIKKKIETLVLEFTLKVTNDVVHGHITRKQIHKQLEKRNIHIDTRLIENVKINALGSSFVSIHLFKNVEAELKIEVISEK